MLWTASFLELSGGFQVLLLMSVHHAIYVRKSAHSSEDWTIFVNGLDWSLIVSTDFLLSRLIPTKIKILTNCNIWCGFRPSIAFIDPASI